MPTFYCQIFGRMFASSCFVIEETKEIPYLYFSNQTQFEFKSLNGI